nr:InlB B-repeat-containing protein [Olsenella intestinalis]
MPAQALAEIAGTNGIAPASGAAAPAPGPDTVIEPQAAASITVRWDANGGHRLPADVVNEQRSAALAEGKSVEEAAAITEETVSEQASWSTTQAAATALGVLPSAERVGWALAGWAESPDASEPGIDEGTVPTPIDPDAAEKVVTYYAVWQAAYTIRFEANGGAGEMDAQSRTMGDGKALSANAFTREGYTFIGWSTKPDDNGTVYANETVGDFSAEPGQVLTLYATWQKDDAKAPVATQGELPQVSHEESVGEGDGAPAVGLKLSTQSAPATTDNAPVVTLGDPAWADGSHEFVTYPNATISGNARALVLTNSAGKVESGVTPDLGENNNDNTGIWLFFDEYALSGVPAGADGKTAQDVLRQARFAYAAGMKVTVELDANPSTANLAGKGWCIKESATRPGRLFMFVPNDPGTFVEGYNLAKNFTYRGMRGYLATPLSRGEVAEIYATGGGNNTMLGSAVAFHYYNGRLAQGWSYADPDEIFAYEYGTAHLAEGEECRPPDYLPAHRTNSGSSIGGYWEGGKRGTAAAVNLDRRTEREKHTYWWCGPNAGTLIRSTGMWGNGQPDWYGFNNTSVYSVPNSPNYEYIVCPWGSPANSLNDFSENVVYSYEVEFGGYDEGADPSGRVTAAQAANVEDLPSVEVTYSANGHGSYEATDRALVGSTLSEPAAPTAEGYTFGGWYTDVACTDANRWDFASAKVARADDGTLALYAKWVVNEYTVTFHGNGGKTADNAETYTQSFTYDEPAKALTANAFTKDDEFFSGWTTNAADATIAYLDGAKVQNLASASGANVDLYAQWVSAPTLDLGPATDNGDGTVSFRDARIVGKVYTMEVSANEGAITNMQSANPSVISKGHAADLTEFESGTSTVNTKVGTWIYTDESIYGGDTALETLRSLRFQKVEGLAVTVDLDSNPNRNLDLVSGLVSLGGGKYITRTKDQKIMTVQLAAVRTILYRGMRAYVATPVNDAELEALKKLCSMPPAGTYENYRLGAWAAVRADGSKFTFEDEGYSRTWKRPAGYPARNSSVSYSDADKQKVVDLSYWFNGPLAGAMIKNSSLSVSPASPYHGNMYDGYEEGATLGWRVIDNRRGVASGRPADILLDSINVSDTRADGTGSADQPEYELIEFGGYEVGQDPGGRKEALDVTSSTSVFYSVSYDKNASDATFDADAYNNSFATYGNKLAKPDVDPVRTGYVFGGWYTDAACTEANKWNFDDDVIVQGDPRLSGNALTLHAKWTPITYSIAFDPGTGATGTMASISGKSYGEEVTLPECTFVKKDEKAKFLGWATSPTAASNLRATYADRAKVKNLSATGGSTVTLYAVYATAPGVILGAPEWCDASGNALADQSHGGTYFRFPDAQVVGGTAYTMYLNNSGGSITVPGGSSAHQADLTENISGTSTVNPNIGTWLYTDATITGGDTAQNTLKSCVFAYTTDDQTLTVELDGNHNSDNLSGLKLTRMDDGRYVTVLLNENLTFTTSSSDTRRSLTELWSKPHDYLYRGQRGYAASFRSQAQLETALRLVPSGQYVTAATPMINKDGTTIDGNVAGQLTLQMPRPGSVDDFGYTWPSNWPGPKVNSYYGIWSEGDPRFKQLYYWFDGPDQGKLVAADGSDLQSSLYAYNTSAADPSWFNKIGVLGAYIKGAYGGYSGEYTGLGSISPFHQFFMGAFAQFGGYEAGHDPGGRDEDLQTTTAFKLFPRIMFHEDPADRSAITDSKTQMTTIGSKVAKEDVAVTDGYTSDDNWYLDGASAPWDFSNDATDASMQSSDGNIHLYAKFNAHSYKVRFDGNGATSGAMANEDFTYGEAAKSLTKNAYTRTGYTFAGWTDDQAATPFTKASDIDMFAYNVYEDERGVSNLSAEDGATVVLKALWTPDKRDNDKTDTGEGSDNTGEHIAANNILFSLDEAKTHCSRSEAERASELISLAAAYGEDAEGRALELSVLDYLQPAVGEYQVVFMAPGGTSLAITAKVRAHVAGTEKQIAANDFVVAKGQVTSLATSAVALAGATAFDVATRDDLSSTIVADVRAVQAVRGAYDVSFSLPGDGAPSVTVTCTVVDAMGTDITDPDASGLAVSASDFAVQRSDTALPLDSAEEGTASAVGLANARAWVYATGEASYVWYLCEGASTDAAYELDVSAVGDKDVTFVAGKAEAKVVAHVRDSVEVGGKYVAYANGFALGKTEAQALLNKTSDQQAVELVTRANAGAYSTETGALVDPADITVTCEPALVAKPGKYTVTYTVGEGSEATSVSVTLTVSDAYSEDTTNHVAVSANSFVVGKRDDALAAADIISMSGARAWDTQTGQAKDIVVTVDDAELPVGGLDVSSPGSHTITFAVAGTTVSVTVTMTVTDASGISEDGTQGIRANTVRLSVAEAQEVLDGRAAGATPAQAQRATALLVGGAGAVAWDTSTGEALEPVSVLSATIAAVSGTYTVSLASPGEGRSRATVTVDAVVYDAVTVDDSDAEGSAHEGIAANDFAVAKGDAVDLAKATSLAHASAWSTSDGSRVDIVAPTSPTSFSTAVTGVVNVEFATLKGTSVTVRMYVRDHADSGSGTATDESVDPPVQVPWSEAISANDFAVAASAVKDCTNALELAALLRRASNARAVDLLTGNDVAMVVTHTGLAAGAAPAKGVYPVTFATPHGKSVTATCTVYDKVASKDQPADDSVVPAVPEVHENIAANDFAVAKGQAVTSDDVVRLSGARAWDTSTGAAVAVSCTALPDTSVVGAVSVTLATAKGTTVAVTCRVADQAASVDDGTIHQAIAANDIHLAKGGSLTQESAPGLARVRLWDTSTGEDLVATKLATTIASDFDAGVVGAYDVTFASNDVGGPSVTVKAHVYDAVTVDDSGAAGSAHEGIAANDFAVAKGQAVTSDDVVRLSGARAWDTSTGAAVAVSCTALLDTSVVGAVSVTLATAKGTTVSVTCRVADQAASVDDGTIHQAIAANDIHLAKGGSLTQESAPGLARVRLWDTSTGEDLVATKLATTIASDFDAGVVGAYDVTFASNDVGGPSVTVKAHVYDAVTVDDSGAAGSAHEGIAANDFAVAKGSSINLARAIELSSAHAWSTSDGSDVAVTRPTTFDTSVVGDVPVTFETAKGTSAAVTMLVREHVSDGTGAAGDVQLSMNDFVVGKDEVKNSSDADALAGLLRDAADVRAVKGDGGPLESPVSVDAGDLQAGVEPTLGDHDVTFSAGGASATATVTVVDHVSRPGATSTCRDAIAANDFTLALNEMGESSALAVLVTQRSGARAWNADTGATVTGIVADTSGLQPHTGTYSVTFTTPGGASVTASCTVTKGTTNPTAPTEPAELAYTGQPQKLLQGGTTEGGKIQYSTSPEGPWSDEPPTATDAGEYHVWWKVTGGDDWQDTDPQEVVVILEKANNGWAVQPSIEPWTAGQTPSAPVGQASFGSVEFQYRRSGEGDDMWTTAVPVKPGDYEMRAVVSEATNWSGLATTVPFSVVHDTLTYKANSVFAEGLTASFLGSTGDVVSVSDVGFVWPEHSFKGWNTSPDGTGDAYMPGDEYVLSVGSDVLYAQWDPVGELRYDGNGATNGSMASQAGGAGTAVEVRSCSFARDNFRFVGWNTEADGSGDSYQPGDKLKLAIGGNLLYAQWESLPAAGSVKQLVVDDNWGGARIAQGDDYLAEAIELTDDEQSAMISGSDVFVYAVVRDASGVITEEERALLGGALGKGMVSAAYLDVTLCVRVGDGAVRQVTSCKRPVTVSVTLAGDDAARSTYAVSRLHDGRATVVPSAFAAPSLAFDSDQFSLFELAYPADSSVPVTAPDASARRASSTPKTSDPLAMAGAVAVLVAASACGLVLVGARRRKRRA